MFLLCYIDSYLDRLLNVAYGPVELEGPLRLLRLIVDLAQQVVDELMSKRLDLDLGHHLYHVGDHLLSLRDVKLESLVVLFTFLIVLGSAAPLRLSFVVLSDTEVLFRVLLICLQNYLGVLVHDLVALCNHESFLTLTTQDQKLNRLFLEATSLTILGDHQGALRELRLGTENELCLLGVVEVLQVEPDDVFVIVRALVGLLSLSVVLLSLFRLSYHYQD